jgi:hypothetical protein
MRKVFDCDYFLQGGATTFAIVTFNASNMCYLLPWYVSDMHRP